jgi:putative DNA primase/helicase
MTTKLTDNNMRADMAKLHGARLVITSEVDDQQKLSERLLKYLTAGMGKVVACRKFENPIEFDATHKIFMDANYRPAVRGADEAIWARLKCVSFEQHLAEGDPEMDKKLKDKILAESEGVLAWAIRGAIRWSKEGGLGAPPEIKEAGAAWRDADDPLKDFLEDCCEAGDPDEGYWVLGSKLSTAYDQWCKDNREKYTLARGQLTERLILKGFTTSRSRRDSRDKQMRTWEGLKLREDVTLASAPSYAKRGDSNSS